MEERDLKQILAGKQRRRHELARLPIEEKLRSVVRLQELAAPILRARGKTVRCWKLELRAIPDVTHASLGPLRNFSFLISHFSFVPVAPWTSRKASALIFHFRLPPAIFQPFSSEIIKNQPMERNDS